MVRDSTGTFHTAWIFLASNVVSSVARSMNDDILVLIRCWIRRYVVIVCVATPVIRQAGHVLGIETPCSHLPAEYTFGRLKLTIATLSNGS